MDNTMIVAVINGNGKIIHSQPLEMFLRGNRSIPIINYYTGQKLFDILFDELGIIRYEDNKFALKTIIEMNVNNSVMKIAGKVAEAVIVRRCNNDNEINKKWLSLARRQTIRSKTVEKFHAIGTGLLSTKQKFPTRYDVSNPQRDIMWIDNDRKTALVKGSSYCAGLEAGLQIKKVSKDGKAYFFNDLVKMKYEIPVVYFDICNDFDSIANDLYKLRNRNAGISINIGEDFVSARAVDYNAYQEVLYHIDLIDALINGKITPEQLIDTAASSDSSSLKNAIFSAGLSQIDFNNIILGS